MPPRSDTSDKVKKEKTPTTARPMSTFKHYTGRPHLVRTSSLDPQYIRQNLSIVNTPVKLIFDKDLSSMTENWTLEEQENQRRLVKFKFIRLAPSEYYVQFDPIDKEQYDHTSPIISCIFWKEKDLHIVTSVDIILILEYLVQESFSIEEKNRIRRNLQSLKPQTISRTNKQFERFFKLLMAMEDPRPRNIEQDLKVFKWSDLFRAINKVISKYSVVDDAFLVDTTNPTHQRLIFSSPSSIGGNIASSRASSLATTASEPLPAASAPLPASAPLVGSQPYTNNIVLHFNQHLNQHMNNHQNFQQQVSNYQNQQGQVRDASSQHNQQERINGERSEALESSGEPVFLPSERLKVLKRKLNKVSPSNSPSAFATSSPSTPNFKNNLFQHALKPSDPVPLTNGSPKESGEQTITVKQENDSPQSVDSPPEPVSEKPERNSQTSLGAKSDDSTISGPSDPTSSNDESSGSNSNSGPSFNSVPSNEQNSLAASQSGNTRSEASSGSTNVFSNGSSVQDSLNTSGNTSVGTYKLKSRPPGLSLGESLKTSKPHKNRSKDKLHRTAIKSEKNHNINKYAEDQRNRVFGGNYYDENHVQTKNENNDLDKIQPNGHSLQYYQYPPQSMLYTQPQDHTLTSSTQNKGSRSIPSLSNIAMANPLSTSNIQKHDLQQRQQANSSSLHSTLPSILRSFDAADPKSITLSPIGISLNKNDEHTIKLPPILSRENGSEISSNVGSGIKLPGPSKINEYWRNFNPPTRTGTDPYFHHSPLPGNKQNEKSMAQYSGPHTFTKLESSANSEQPPHKVQATKALKENQTMQ